MSPSRSSNAATAVPASNDTALRRDGAEWRASPAAREVVRTASIGQMGSLFAALFGLWFAMSGHTEAWLIVAGAACSALTVWISCRLGVLDSEGHPIQLLGRAFSYAAWLLVEIVKSNISVARVILFDPRAVDPRLVRFKASQTSDLGRVVHANSITLTPGTVTVDIDPDGTFTVHALHAEGRNGLLDGGMDRRVCRFVGEG